MTHIHTHILPLFTTPGTFLEIGCWDGEHISQTAELERLGWIGTCVDPFPRNFNNRSCQVIKAAISKDGKPREFVHVTIDRRYGGDVSYFSGFKDSINVHWPLINEHCDYTTQQIPTTRFDALPIPKHINFLSVDTEGSELEIFQSIDFKKFSFDVIMFEHNEVDNGVAALLERKGYRLHERLRIDDIFVNKKFIYIGRKVEFKQKQNSRTISGAGIVVEIKEHTVIISLGESNIEIYKTDIL